MQFSLHKIRFIMPPFSSSYDSVYANPELKVTHRLLLLLTRFFRFSLPRGWHVMLCPDWQHAGRRAGINQMHTRCVTAREWKSGSVSRCHGAILYVILRLLWQVGTVRLAACRKESYKENTLQWHNRLSCVSCCKCKFFFFGSVCVQTKQKDRTKSAHPTESKACLEIIMRGPQAEPNISLTLKILTALTYITLMWEESVYLGDEDEVGGLPGGITWERGKGARRTEVIHSYWRLVIV